MNEISSIQQSPLFAAIQRHRSALTGILAAIAVTASVAVSADEPRVAEVRNLDWVEADQMDIEQLLSVASTCCGAYIEPERTYPDADMDPEEASLLVIAIKHHGAIGLVYARRIAADLPVALRYLNVPIKQSHVVGEGFRSVGIDQQRSLLRVHICIRVGSLRFNIGTATVTGH